jgi:hypothetical protein
MVERCANPACSAPFDYRQGRLYFRPMKLLDGSQPASYHGVKHHWLCASCSKTYSFDFQAKCCVLPDQCGPVTFPSGFLGTTKCWKRSNVRGKTLTSIA